MMKKIILLIVSAVFLSGCATYKFQRGRAPYEKGYVVSRDDRIIVEYTVGKDNSVPNLEVARQRFRERRNMVEHYYARMGYIKSGLKSAFWDPIVLFLKFIGGIFRLPAIAISDYKYEHDPQYREQVIKKQEEEEALEAARVKKLKDEMDSYIQKEIALEESSKHAQ